MCNILPCLLAKRKLNWIWHMYWVIFKHCDRQWWAFYIFKCHGAVWYIVAQYILGFTSSWVSFHSRMFDSDKKYLRLLSPPATPPLLKKGHFTLGGNEHLPSSRRPDLKKRKTLPKSVLSALWMCCRLQRCPESFFRVSVILQHCERSEQSSYVCLQS